MKTRIRLITGLGLAGCTAVLIMVLRPDTPPAATTERKKQPVIVASPVHRPPAPNFKMQPPHSHGGPLLPPPVLPTAPTATEPAPANVEIPVFKARPPEESMLSSWAARDPEGAGRWLNQNRNHPKFADMVRGYAIQIATTDPAAARKWAAVLNGNGNRFARGGTLEQHIDAIEAMLKGPAAPQTGQQQELPGPSLLADYYPVLVRQNPDEPPVLEMQPSNPIA